MFFEPACMLFCLLATHDDWNLNRSTGLNLFLQEIRGCCEGSFSADLHIVWSEVYAVPQLFIRVYSLPGKESGRGLKRNTGAVSLGQQAPGARVRPGSLKAVYSFCTGNS